MYRVSVEADNKHNTHDISLSDGKIEVGLIVCDASGAHDPFNISRNPISRSAMKTTSGSQKYGDMVPPWLPIAQENFEGGRGMEDFAEDATRFFDSFRAQTAFKEIYNAPMEYYSTGYRRSNTNYPNSVSWIKMKDGASNYIAVAFMPSVNYAAGQIYVLLRKRGNPTSPLVIELCGNSAGDPGSVLKSHSYTNADITDTISEFRKFSLSGVSFTAGQTYWIKAHCADATEDDYWQIGVKQSAGSTKQSTDNIIWKSATFDLYYRVTDDETERKVKFFRYKYLMFAVYQQDSGAPKLFVNGTIGTADSNSGQLGKTIDSSKAWIVNQWAGCMVGIIAGKGYEEPSVYRNIASNTANSLTVDRPWTIPQDTTTQYVIFNTGTWTEIPAAQHGLTSRVTDICVVNDIVYFAQGDYKPIRRLRWAVAGTDGGWVAEDEQSNALYLTTVRHTKRGLELWRANNDDKNHAISVSRASVIDWLGNSMTLLNQTTAVTAETKSAGVDFVQGDDIGLQYKMTIGAVSGTNASLLVTLQESDDNAVFTNVKQFRLADAVGTYYLSACCTKRWRRVVMTTYGTSPSFNNIKIVTENNLRFAEPVSFHDSFGKINKIIEYSEDQIKNLWVMREGMVFTVKTDTTNSEVDYADPMSLPELNTVMEENNGSSSITSNVYLYFTLGNGIQRFYNQKLDADGADRDAGLPTNRQGIVSALLGYPGRYFASIDAGKDGYSSILLNNGSGWHEIYRAPNKGERILDMSFQAIPTGVPDRLWFSCGDDILWLVMPSKTLKAVYDVNAEYTHESAFVSAWHTGGMADISKTWNSLKLISEGLADERVTVEADYQVDQDGKWYPLPEDFKLSPSQEVQIVEKYGAKGKRFRYRLRLQTTDKTLTPRIKTTVIEAIGTVAIKYSFSFSYRNHVHDLNLRDEPEDIAPDERQMILDDWANTLQPLIMHSSKKMFDNKRVYLEAPVFRVGKEGEEGYIGTLLASEI